MDENLLREKSQYDNRGKVQTVILANGKFPTSEFALSYFYGASYLVCCDGAVLSALEHGRVPDYIVGDMDSTPIELQSQLANRIVRYEEQETNDLAKAFNFCREKGLIESVVILGATGKREDHTLGNLARLVDFAMEIEDITLVTDEGYFITALYPGDFDSQPGRQISIFSFDPDQKISSKGLKYPLDNLTLPRWYVATLNEALDARFSLEFDPNLSPLLLFFANEKKNAS